MSLSRSAHKRALLPLGTFGIVALASVGASHPAAAKAHHKPAPAAARRKAAPGPQAKPRDLMATHDENVSVSARRAVQGGGLMTRQTEAKSISMVTQDYIAKQSPLVNPGVLVSSLPGVQGTNEGPLSTTSETIHIRGLDQTQIGMIYEACHWPTPSPMALYLCHGG